MLAVFAGVQLIREAVRSRELARSADARISAQAFLLWRQLRSWLGVEPPLAGGFAEWLDSTGVDEIKSSFDVAEQRIVELLSSAGSASRGVAVNLRKSFVAFFAGTNRVNEYKSARPKSVPDMARRYALESDAEKHLTACLKALEAGPVGVDLLQGHLALQKQPTDDNQ